jgi:hypothetical protein
MLNAIISLFRPNPTALRDRFLERFSGKTIIVHQGLSIGWVGELAKEAGGGGHFRIDARRAPGSKPTPIEWVVHRWVLPQHLPMPLLIQVREDALLIRHLVRNDLVVHPSEINWMIGEFPARFHLCLRPSGKGFLPERGMPVSENDINFDV